MSHAPGQPRPVVGRTSVANPGLTPLEPRLLLSASLYDPQEPLAPVSGEQAEVVAQAAGDQTFGIDVSHWQGAINWTSVANDGIDFVWAKATQGVNYTDPNWFSYATGAHNAGLYIGGYHFATPYTSGIDDAVAEAGDFYDAVSSYLGDGYLRPMLDVEYFSGMTSITVSQRTQWIHDFMNAFSTLSEGIVPIIYMGTSWATSEVNSSVNVYDLWLANWTHDPNNPPSGNADGVWNGYDLWQYTNSESVSGISGVVDGDLFFGNLNEFAAKYAINTTPDDHGDGVGDATPVSTPSVTIGEIGGLSDSDWFELNLTAGTSYTFGVIDNGLGYAALTLNTSVGNPIVTDNGPASGGLLAELTYTPITTQTYYVSIDSTSAGGYFLTAQETDDHGDTIADASELVGGFGLGGLQTGSDADVFHFTATAGMDYAIELQSFGLTQGAISLYNGSGTLLDQQSGSSSPLAQLDYSAAADGEMYIEVYSDTGALGDYLLSLAESEPAIPGDLDGDGFVGLSDLDIILNNWNQSVPPADPAADPSGDDYVGLDDLDLILNNWNMGTPPAAEAFSANQDETTAAAAGTQILGIDVSQFQNTINWSTVASSSDRAFAFIRAVDRYGSVDTRFEYNIVNALSAGVLAGAYHFVTPWTDGYNDAVDEARLFATTLAPYITDGYLRPVIDVEGYSGTLSPDPIDLSNTVLTNWIHDYMAEFVRLTGVEPLIYTNTYYAQNAYDTGVNVYDLWLANWTNDPNNPPSGNADGVWNGYDFWQYSGGGETVPGISGGVDGDVYFGSVTDLATNYGIVIAPDDYGNDKFNTTALSVPSNTSGTIDTIMDEDWFEVSLSGGVTYDFSVLGTTLTEAELSILTFGGTELATDSGPASGITLAELSYTPTLTNTYYVRVRSAAEVGDYILTTQETDDHGDSIAEATDLTVGGFALGGLQTASDVDMFHFTATNGKQYDIEAHPAGLADATLTLYDALGAVVDQVIGTNGANPLAALSWVATADAQMYVEVSSDNGSIGDYLITLDETDPSIPGDLDGDGFVGLSDLDIILNNWNQNVPPADPAADPSGDDYVGLDDLDIILNHWNEGTPPAVEAQSLSQTETIAPENSAAQQSTEARTGAMEAAALTSLRDETRSAFLPNALTDDAPTLGLWEENV